MIDAQTRFNADKAYKDSKLCNLLMGLELSRRHPNIPVTCWSPGLVIPRSNDGFFRDSRRANPLGQMLFGLLARDLLRVTERPERAGELLTSLVLDTEKAGGFRYLSNSLNTPGQHSFGPGDLSEEAEDQVKAATLWSVSSDLITRCLSD